MAPPGGASQLVELLSGEGGAGEDQNVDSAVEIRFVVDVKKTEPIYQTPPAGIQEQQGRRGLTGRRIVHLQYD